MPATGLSPILMERERIHILGICGTAMAGIAVLAKEMGMIVEGCDRNTYPPMSDMLRRLEIPCLKGFAVSHLDGRFDRIIIGNALSRGNEEVEAVLDRGLPFTSGAAFVGERVLPGRFPVVVAGTHGKTTTSSLVAHILECAGVDPGFLIGGIPENFQVSARVGRGAPFVLEGDEYDTAFFDKRPKFLHYRPRMLVLNNLEYDHADIYPDLEAIKSQFHQLVRLVPSSGLIVFNADDANLSDVLAQGCWSRCVGFSQRGRRGPADWEWESISRDGSTFRLWHRGRTYLECKWKLCGIHNIANACAASAAAHALGVDSAAIEKALVRFDGVRRRATLIGRPRGIRIVDDFAHHPTAIRHVVAAMRATTAERGKLWVVVEPRSNTMRRKVHEASLPQAFVGADHVLFVPPKPRGLKPHELLDVEFVCRAIGPHAQVFADASEIIRFLLPRLSPGDTVLILSNGDFEGLHQRLKVAIAGQSGV